MTLLLQMTSSNTAAAQQVRELKYFIAAVQQQDLVISARLEHLQRQLIDHGVLPQFRRSSCGGVGGGCPCVSRAESSSCATASGYQSSGSKSCSVEQLVQQLCASLTQQQHNEL
jgi:hypothetical protein